LQLIGKFLLEFDFNSSLFENTVLNLRFWWPEVAWFGHIAVFKLIVTKSNISYDVISVTLSILSRWKTSPN